MTCTVKQKFKTNDIFGKEAVYKFHNNLLTEKKYRKGLFKF